MGAGLVCIRGLGGGLDQVMMGGVGDLASAVIHSDHRAGHRADPAHRRHRLGSRRPRPPALHPGRDPGHPPLRRPSPVRPVPDRLAPAGQIRPRQTRHPHPLLPRLRCAARLQRRLPQRPVRHLPLRRTRPALPLPRLPGLLPPHRQAHGHHGHAAAHRPGTRQPHDHLRQTRRTTRPQHPCPCASGRKWKHCRSTGAAQ